jgi:NDP-sugar pyrophosphorylase family protein
MAAGSRPPDAGPELPSLCLLAGGRATRLGAISRHRPKSLVRVAGAPFIAHQLTLLRDRGVTRVVICVGHLGDQIRDYVGDGARWDLRVDYSDDGDSPAGTGGAVARALPLLPRSFFVMYGDAYLDVDFRRVAAAFRAAGRPGLVCVLHNHDRWEPSNVAFDGDRVLAYDRRADGLEWVDYGLSLLRAETVAGWAAARAAPLDLGDLYSELAGRGELTGFAVERRFHEIGRPGTLAATSRHLREAAPRPIV